jgi:hypothetical protein
MRHLLVLSLVLLMMSLFAVVALAQPPGAARVYSCAELKQAPIPNTTITLAQAQAQLLISKFLVGRKT